MVEVAAEKNSTLVLPFPVEMLRYFEAVATGEPAAARPSAPATREPSVAAAREPVDGALPRVDRATPVRDRDRPERTVTRAPSALQCAHDGARRLRGRQLPGAGGLVGAARPRSTRSTWWTTVGRPDALLRAVAEHRPDAVLTDIRMPPTFTTEGIDAAKRIRAEHPGIGVVVLSQYVEEDYAFELLVRRRRRARLPAQGARRRRSTSWSVRCTRWLAAVPRSTRRSSRA